MATAFSYIEAQISNPVSGLNVYVNYGEQGAALEKLITGKLGAIRFRWLGIRCSDDVFQRPGDSGTHLRFSWTPSAESPADSRMFVLQPKSPMQRLTFGPRAGVRDEKGWELPQFGVIGARLYVNLAAREFLIPIPSALPAALSRHRMRKADRTASEAQAARPLAPPAPVPDAGQVNVQLALPGQPELSFRVPTAEAFGLALDWTRKGYAR